ncbi:MAG: hypothetical protein ACREAC_12565, partial [Blastocatellia bacterium]
GRTSLGTRRESDEANSVIAGQASKNRRGSSATMAILKSAIHSARCYRIERPDLPQLMAYRRDWR